MWSLHWFIDMLRLEICNIIIVGWSTYERNPLASSIFPWRHTWDKANHHSPGLYVPQLQTVFISLFIFFISVLIIYSKFGTNIAFDSLEIKCKVLYPNTY